MLRNVMKKKSEKNLETNEGKTYVVRVIRAIGGHPLSFNGNGLGDTYRVRIWPDNQDIPSVETRLVRDDSGGDIIFDQSLTFHYSSCAMCLSRDGHNEKTR